MSPAECVILLNETKTTQKEILKLTLTDLILKKVFVLEQSETQAHEADPVRVQHQIMKGPHFGSYQQRNQLEQVFFEVFHHLPDSKLLLKSFIKMVVQNAQDAYTFNRKRLFKDDRISSLLDLSFWNKLIARIKLNENGIRTKRNLEAEIQSLQTQLPVMLATNKLAFADKVDELGANLFLLGGGNPELLAEIDLAIQEAMKAKPYDEDTSGGDFFFWYGMDTHSTHFDDGFDSGGDSSGCGGDSGCSGCGGCGGD